jgi:hypothetical protein
MVMGAMIYESVASELVPGYRCTVTVGFDGVHMIGTLHSKDDLCRALDFRTKDYPLDKTQLRYAVKDALGADFDVVLENEGKDQEHIHVEWDPK